MASKITPTIAPAKSGMGWSNGMAAQVSLPSMLFPRSTVCARTDFVDWAGTRRERLCDDLLEEIGSDVAIGEGRHAQTLLREVRIALLGQRRASLARRIDPCRELLGRNCFDVEVHG